MVQVSAVGTLQRSSWTYSEIYYRKQPALRLIARKQVL
jgi:hypothetical protein